MQNTEKTTLSSFGAPWGNDVNWLVSEQYNGLGTVAWRIRPKQKEKLHWQGQLIIGISIFADLPPTYCMKMAWEQGYGNGIRQLTGDFANWTEAVNFLLDFDVNKLRNTCFEFSRNS